MKNVFSKLLRSIFGEKGGSAKLRNSIIHLPDDLIDPAGFVVYSGTAESDVWPAVFIANTLQREYPGKELIVICSSRDSDLFNMLRMRPSVHSYEGRPKIPDTIDTDSIPAGMIFIYPYTELRNDAENLLSNTICRIRMAPLNHSSPYINLRIKTESEVYPDILSEMCSAVGISYDSDWKPAVPDRMEEIVEHKIAPVSGRMLPYIVTTPSALLILEKKRAEIPLRTVSLSGRNSDFDHLDREIKTVVIADASAVITDSDDLWGDACAHGVPVVGIDRSETFLRWNNNKPALNEEEFAEAWIRLLKIGW